MNRFINTMNLHGLKIVHKHTKVSTCMQSVYTIAVKSSSYHKLEAKEFQALV